MNISKSKIQSKPTIGIFYSREPYSNGAFYKYSLKTKQFMQYPTELVLKGKAHNYDIVILCKEDSYIGHGYFKHYWVPTSKIGVFRKINKIVKIAAIYDKGHFTMNDGFVVQINNLSLSRLGRNKYTQSKIFAEYMPKTLLVYDKTSLSRALNKIMTNKIVVKPLDENGGKDIIIGYKKDILNLNLKKPHIVQEFVESCDGIEGLSKGRHDCRIYIINGESVGLAIREPKSGLEIANTSLGGSIKFYKSDRIPDLLKGIISLIDDKLNCYGDRFYSADFIYGNGRWYLLEINDRPGIPCNEQTEIADHIHERIVTLVSGALNANY